MAISAMVARWSEPTTVYVISNTGSKADKYNQYTYTSSTVYGRLVKAEKSIETRGGKDEILAEAQFYTATKLSIDSKIGDYKIISEKECKDKYGVIQFYKYQLGNSARVFG